MVVQRMREFQALALRLAVLNTRRICLLFNLSLPEIIYR